MVKSWDQLCPSRINGKHICPLPFFSGDRPGSQLAACKAGNPLGLGELRIGLKTYKKESYVFIWTLLHIYIYMSYCVYTDMSWLYKKKHESNSHTLSLSASLMRSARAVTVCPRSRWFLLEFHLMPAMPAMPHLLLGASAPRQPATSATSKLTGRIARWNACSWWAGGLTLSSTIPQLTKGKTPHVGGKWPSNHLAGDDIVYWFRLFTNMTTDAIVIPIFAHLPNMPATHLSRCLPRAASKLLPLDHLFHHLPWCERCVSGRLWDHILSNKRSILKSCVCIYIYMYMCVHVCMYVCIYIIYIYMYVYI